MLRGVKKMLSILRCVGDTFLVDNPGVRAGAVPEGARVAAFGELERFLCAMVDMLYFQLWF